MSEKTPISPIPSGMQRQQQIYTLGLTGGALSVPVSLSLLEQKAKDVLSAPAFDYVAGGAGGEATMRANGEAFHRWRIVPRMLRDVSKRDLSVELFGEQLPAPVILGPVGVQGILHAEGELASARAAATLGLPFTLSTAASRR
jgi:lactate 2-monooxygenase